MGLLRQVWREIGARPGVTGVALLTLGLGIAINTVVFSGVYALLLRELPYPGGDRLVVLGQKSVQEGERGLALGDLAPWRRQNPVFEDLAAARRMSVNLAEASRPTRLPAERITGALVTETLFPMLGGRALLGRAPGPGDFVAGAPRVVVLGRDLWKRRFQADRSILGRDVLLDGVAYSVIGVMPEGFRFPDWADLWVPLPADLRSEALSSGSPDWTVLARLRPGRDAAQANRELLPWLVRSARARSERADGLSATVTALREVRAPRYARAALVLQVTVGLVLLVACANLAGLLLARGEERRTEITIRRALGAGPARIAGQLLAEAAALGVAGCLLGILGAHLGLRILLAVIPWHAVGVAPPTLSLPVLGIALALALATSLAAGLVPSLRAARQDLTPSLTAGALTSTEGPRGRLRGGRLAVVQVAFATALLVSAGLSLRALADLTLEDPGFATEGALVLSVFTPTSKTQSIDEARYLDGLLEAITRIPGVEAAGAAGFMPLVGYNPETTLLYGGPGGADQSASTRVHYQPVRPGFFRAMGVPVLRGRGFEDRDRGDAGAVLVNRTLAHRLWPGREALGRTVWLPGISGQRALTVTGVVADMQQQGLAGEPLAEIYFVGSRAGYSTVVARTGGRTAAVAAALREELARRQGDGAAFRLGTMTQFIAAHLEKRRIFLELLGSFAIMALGVAALGIYGMSSYRVSRRGREFGVRRALGARGVDVLRLVLTESLRVAVVGVLLGLVLSVGLSGVLRSAVAGIRGADPVVGAGLALLVVLVAVAASYAPALRAARADPRAILRGER
jgi:putative ABC transport system permease protein